METGGLENGIVNLVNNSNQAEFTIDVLCLRKNGELSERITNKNSSILFDGNTSHSMLTAIRKVKNACSNGNYHIIHSHGFSTMIAAYVGGFLARCPIIMNGEHGTLYFSSLKQRLLQKWLFKKMAINLTVSGALKNEIKSRFNIKHDNFKPIINGVDTVKFSPNKTTRKNIREVLSINNEQIVIGSVGRLVPVKNYISLINAFYIVSSKNPTCALIIAGDGPDKQKLVDLISKLQLNDKVKLLGRRDDIPSVMNALDIFVLPSFREGLSNTLLESMSSGTPVIACDVGGNKEIIIPGETGYLYPSDNVERLSEILNALLSNTNNISNMSVNSSTHILKNYSISAMVKNYENTYQKLISKYRIKIKYTNEKSV
jgi:Glycosyltransferase